ncbi:MAG: hypothetical protein C4530_03650 [Desulfobacteraceae bacterium]|nr:MAG: hypothetical protein C4530_03650 [Desulfobacteraceae bacterium]
MAALEQFVQLGDESQNIRSVCFKAEIPYEMGIEEIDTGSLPKNWKETPAPGALKVYGAAASGTAPLNTEHSLHPLAYVSVISRSLSRESPLSWLSVTRHSQLPSVVDGRLRRASAPRPSRSWSGRMARFAGDIMASRTSSCAMASAGSVRPR